MPPRLPDGNEESCYTEGSRGSGVGNSGGENPLTSTPDGIHCVPTQEADEMMVNAFLDALAEVALSVAARSIAQGQKRGQEG